VRAARAQAARPAGSEALAQENKHLRAQLARAETERDMLKKALTIAQMLEAHFHKRRAEKRCAFIALHAACWPVQQHCQVLGVSASGYYAWRTRLPAAAGEQAPPAWQVAAQRVFTTHAGRYGQRRLRAQLRREGHDVGRQRLRAWLTASGLRTLCTRSSTRPPRTTQADPQAVAAANKLASWPAATAPTTSGWATSPTWPWPRGSGRIWPAGAMLFPDASWAGP